MNNGLAVDIQSIPLFLNLSLVDISVFHDEICLCVHTGGSINAMLQIQILPPIIWLEI
jgi:hypothetical protein